MNHDIHSEVNEVVYKFLSDNPVVLLSELRKLIASHKAGHPNVYNEVNAICKRLLEQGYINEKKYKKILKKIK